MEKPTLTHEQLSAIGGLLHMGFKEIMLLNWAGKSEQSADLADALYQIPLRMFSPGFSC